MEGQVDQKLRGFAKVLRDAFDNRYGEMVKLGDEPGYIQDYMPHLYKDADKAGNFFTQFVAKRPMEGTKFFKRGRTFPTLDDAIKAGLEPVTDNPATMARLALHQMDKYIAVRQTKAELSGTGQRMFISAGDKIPAGWAPSVDRADTVFGKSAQGEKVIRGQYAYPEPIMALMDNYLSPGLSKYAAYRGWMWAKNQMNMFNLGYSGFHVVTTGLNSYAAKIGEITQGGGKVGTPAGLAKLAAAPVAHFFSGSKMLREWAAPGSVGGEYTKAVAAMVAGGGRAYRPDLYRNTIIKNFLGAIGKGNYLGAAIRLPGTIAQLGSHVIMEGIVPRIKAGAAFDQIRMAMEKNQGMPLVGRPIRDLIAPIVDRGDDMFGELTYENLFLNKTLEHTIQAFFRAPGWSFGTLRGAATAAADTLKTPARMRGGARPISDAMGKAIGVVVTTALVNAMIQKMLTGKNPGSSTDLLAPQTNLRDKYGNPVRLWTPTYARVMYSWIHNPLLTMTHSIAPGIGDAIALYQNKNFYGDQIRDVGAPVSTQAKQVGKFEMQQRSPFSLQSGQRLSQEGAGLGTQLLSAAGIQHAPSELIRTPAENLITQMIQAQQPTGGYTAQQAGPVSKPPNSCRRLRQEQCRGDESRTGAGCWRDGKGSSHQPVRAPGRRAPLGRAAKKLGNLPAAGRRRVQCG